MGSRLEQAIVALDEMMIDQVFQRLANLTSRFGTPRQVALFLFMGFMVAMLAFSMLRFQDGTLNPAIAFNTAVNLFCGLFLYRQSSRRSDTPAVTEELRSTFAVRLIRTFLLVWLAVEMAISYLPQRQFLPGIGETFYVTAIFLLACRAAPPKARREPRESRLARGTA